MSHEGLIYLQMVRNFTFLTFFLYLFTIITSLEFKNRKGYYPGEECSWHPHPRLLLEQLSLDMQRLTESNKSLFLEMETMEMKETVEKILNRSVEETKKTNGGRMSKVKEQTDRVTLLVSVIISSTAYKENGVCICHKFINGIPHYPHPADRQIRRPPGFKKENDYDYS